MHTIEIPQRGITRQIPSTIEEMSGDQFVFFIELIIRYLGGEITIDMFKVMLIKELLGIRFDSRYFFLPEEVKKQIHAEVYRLGELTESFFEEYLEGGKPMKAFRLSFVKNFIPKICRRYYGPKDALQDVTFCEYRTAHAFYAEYLKSHNEKDLNRLIAVLYRPRKKLLAIRRLLSRFDGQKRIPFTSKSNPILLESRSERISHLPMPVRYGIFLFFAGCEEFLQKGRMVIDGNEIDLSVLYETRTDNHSPSVGLVGLLYTLAETKVFGSTEETDGQMLYDILVRLYQVVQQQKELEEKYGIG